MTAPEKRSIYILLDTATYSSKLLLSLIDMAEVCKLTGYADLKIVMPRSVLFESTGKQALSPEDIADLPDQKFSKILQAAMQNNYLVIPEEMNAEREKFNEIRKRVAEQFPDPSLFTNKLLAQNNRGKYSDYTKGIDLSDLGDRAFNEWHEKHFPELGKSDVILFTEDRELIKPIRARDETRNEGKSFDQFRNATAIGWMQEEYDDIKKHMATITLDTDAKNRISVIDKRLQPRITSMSTRKENINTTDIDQTHEQRLRDALDTDRGEGNSRA